MLTAGDIDTTLGQLARVVIRRLWSRYLSICAEQLVVWCDASVYSSLRR